jgi:hypothetical protein
MSCKAFEAADLSRFTLSYTDIVFLDTAEVANGYLFDANMGSASSRTCNLLDSRNKFELAPSISSWVIYSRDTD